MGLVVVALLATAGCGSEDRPGNSTTSHVTFTTAFNAAGRDAPAWVAREKGYFKEADIDVDIQLGAATDKNLLMIRSGKAQFAALDMTGAMIDAGQREGAETGFRIIAAIHQRTLVSIITFDRTVQAPTDLSGLNIGAAPGSVNQKLFPAYARLAGLDPKTVRFTNVPIASLTDALVGGRVDALSTFLIGRAGIERRAGKPATVLPYSEYMRDVYGNALIVSDAIAKTSPDLAIRFRDAYLKGLRYTLDHPDEAGEILHKYQPATAVADVVSEVSAMKPYSDVPPLRLGALDGPRLARAISTLQSLGLTPPGLRPEDLVDFGLALQG